MGYFTLFEKKGERPGIHSSSERQAGSNLTKHEQQKVDISSLNKDNLLIPF